MTPEQIDRVFGRGRLKMVTGEHVEVYREAVAPGERRRYTKRFLNTPDGDFGQWTEREWRILARLIGHGITCVPDVVQIDRGRFDGAQLVQTYDAGVTVDQWATLLPVTRDGRVYGHVFEDCAHWWALAHHCLLALDVIHPLELVHLDIKGDNVCIPYAPASFNPESADLHLQPVFGQLALIDFAFALISRASLTTPLPLGWQKDYDYQSPRLLAALEAGRNSDLQPTRELDWRCDLYSLAAMLKRYLPEETFGLRPPRDAGWTAERYDAAKALILRIRECHDGDLPLQRPHAALIEATSARLREDDLALSLVEGWTLAREASVSSASASPLTPVTLLAPPIRVVRSGRVTAVTVMAGHEDRQTLAQQRTPAVPLPMPAPAPRKRRERAAAALIAATAFAAVGAALWYTEDKSNPVGDRLQALLRPHISTDDERDGSRPPVDSDEGAPRSDANVDKTAAAIDSGSPGPAAKSPPATRRVVEESALGPGKEVAADSASTATSRAAAESAPTAGRRAAAESAPTTSPLAADSPVGGTVVAQSPTPGTPVLSSPDATNAPVAAPPDTPLTSTAQSRGAESRAPTLESRKLAPATPSKQASVAQRSAEKASRAQATAAARSAQTRPTTPKEPKETKEVKERVYAPWASLEPPAWALSSYRGKGPGVPRGATTSEPRGPSGASSVESALAPSATISAGAPTATIPAPAPSAAVSAAVTRNDSTSPNMQAASRVPAASSPPPASPAPSLASLDAPRVESAAPSPTVAHATSAVNADRVAQEDYAALGRQTLQEVVPRIVVRAEPLVARVLGMAANAYHLLEERAVAEASRAARIADVEALPLQRTAAAAEARRLNDDARTAIRLRRDAREAMELQLRAFGANPRDPEVAGNLASLYLKTVPPQPEMARQLALFALTARAPQFHSARMEDWHTLAIASALSGRDSDARNALFVTLALTADVDARCLATLNAVATYGERLRKPVEAMFYRLHTQGRGIGSQACAWPPNGSVLSRLQ